jgi:hypothetical protein
MIQVHLWIPNVVEVSDWELKINACLDDLASSFENLDLGPLNTHVRYHVFSAEQLKLALEEALFIPVVRQLHVLVLTDYDVIPLDTLRLVDQLTYIDSIARLTRRIQVLVFDILSPAPSIPKVTGAVTTEIKEGIKAISSVVNSRIVSGDPGAWSHDNSFANCSGCNALIRVSFIVVLLKLTLDTYSELQ